MSELQFSDIIWFALTKKSTIQRTLYFMKGIIFYLFFMKKSIHKKGEASSALSQAGDDIYPLF